MAEPNNFPIAGLLFIILALTALGYLLLAYSINIWPFASKPTCDNIDGNGNSFTCTTGTPKSGVTCATSPCTKTECCTDSGPSPPPPSPPTPPSAVCQNTTQGGHGWNAIKGCDNANCENLKGDCSAGGQGTRQCYKWTLPYGTCSISDDSTWSNALWAQKSCSTRGGEEDCKNKNYDADWENSDCKWTTDPRRGECQELESPPDACFTSEISDKQCSSIEDKDSCESCTATLDCCEPVSIESFRRR